MHKCFLRGNLREGDNLEDLDIDEILLKHPQEMGRGDVGWIYMAQHMDRRWAFLNVVMNLRA
jgi:hypothetical protein